MMEKCPEEVNEIANSEDTVRVFNVCLDLSIQMHMVLTVVGEKLTTSI